jgi:hypothetical protein
MLRCQDDAKAGTLLILFSLYRVGTSWDFWHSKVQNDLTFHLVIATFSVVLNKISMKANFNVKVGCDTFPSHGHGRIMNAPKSIH